MTHNETTKNHPGGIQDRSIFEKTARMYETESENDVYRALSLYISKLNPKCEALFQQPRRDWNESAITPEIWYENRPFGGNTLGNIMKEISTKAKLSKVYTNHCVRATTITLWSQAGLSDRHRIYHISEHRSPNSLQHYRDSRPSSTQLRKCSDVLSSALQGANQAKQKSPRYDEPVSQLKAAEVSAEWLKRTADHSPQRSTGKCLAAHSILAPSVPCKLNIILLKAKVSELGSSFSFRRFFSVPAIISLEPFFILMWSFTFYKRNQSQRAQLVKHFIKRITE